MPRVARIALFLVDHRLGDLQAVATLLDPEVQIEDGAVGVLEIRADEVGRLTGLGQSLPVDLVQA